MTKVSPPTIAQSPAIVRKAREIFTGIVQGSPRVIRIIMLSLSIVSDPMIIPAKDPAKAMESSCTNRIRTSSFTV